MDSSRRLEKKVWRGAAWKWLYAPGSTFLFFAEAAKQWRSVVRIAFWNPPRLEGCGAAGAAAEKAQRASSLPPVSRLHEAGQEGQWQRPCDGPRMISTLLTLPSPFR